MPIAPTLILGLGGTGSRIVQSVANKVRDSETLQSERIAFVTFDTDINDLGRIRRESPEIHTVQTSTRNTVGEYLNINTNARDNWFPVNEMLNRKTLTEGAAQVRAISRLAFDTTLKGGNLAPLHQAIEQLFRIDKDQEEQALRVIITSSLAGGTGSGLILSVAMYLASYLRAQYPKAKAITRGFFIQPDVFYHVIKATDEQQNLQVNAYAAVRELDAFLMKGDNTLPPQYRDLAFEFPRVGVDGVEAVTAMPYDFCFLFDAKNTVGGSLDSFASYLDHAATCIYTQSIGPMSKKSNSREDNVLREVIKNDGRNRYAGAGASRLVYPWAHVRDVVGLKWANLALSTQWLQFDDQFRDQLEALAKQRERGLPARDLDLPTVFIGSVDAAAANREPFARAIQGQCLSYDEDGITVVGKRWLEYLSALKNHVKVNSASSGDAGLERNARARISALAESADADDYISTYYDLKKYHAIVERNVEETAGLLGYSMFHSDSTSTKDRHPHQLETYLREKIGNTFIHPVSARYFLYQTILALRAEKQQVQVALDNTRRFFDNYEKNAFDDPSTEEIESPEQLAQRKRGLMEKLRGKPGAALQELSESFTSYLRKVRDLQEQSVYVSVLDEAIDYTTGMATAFQTFFTVLSGNLKRLRSDIDLKSTAYDDLTGSTTRYVLATSKSLESLAKSMPYTGGVVSIDSDLSEAIYNRVRGYHMLTDEKDGTYFQDLYKTTILGYFADQVMSSYQHLIKIDVIEALEREYKATTKNYEESNVAHYVTGEIDKVKRLAAPFLEQPLGEERHPISACAFNPKLEGDSDPRRKRLVDEHLGDYGGERDEEISEHEVLFYSAIYGIRARDLSKYSPERTNPTEHRSAGTYFDSYYRLVSQIKPAVHQTKVITPHIDRRWHWISKLPDLDEGNQAAQAFGIHRALLQGLVYRKIIWTPVYGDHRVYQYKSDQPLEQDFVVSNGTPCDHFYEVVDALTIDPVAVTEITESIDRWVSGQRQDARTVEFAKTDFAKALTDGIVLTELADVVPAMTGKRVTIFDVVAFYALSVPRELYNELEIYQMVKDFLSVVQTEIGDVEEAARALEVTETVLMAQFDEFRSHTELYLAQEGPTFLRSLRRIVRPLADVFQDLHLRAAEEKASAFESDLERR